VGLAESNYKVFALSDMEKMTRESFEKDNPGSSPGRVCGKFAVDNGCMKLIFDKKNNRAIILQHESGGKWTNVYKPELPGNLIYIRKTPSLEREPSSVEGGRDEIEFHYFEKSAVKFYYNGKKFVSKWISD